MEIVVNPTEENPSTLRALALMLNSIASDRDGGPAVKDEAPKPLITQETLPKSPSDNGAAPGASEDLTPPPPPPSANVQGDSNTSGVLDKNGLPWDERIHSSSKNMNADGTWRYLRGGDVDLRATVEAELRAKLASGVSSEAPPPPLVTATTSNNAPDGAGDVPPPPPPPAPAPAADAPPPPPPVAEPQADPAPAGVTAAAVFKRVTELKAANRIDQIGIDMALASVDVESLAVFMKRAKEAGLPELVLNALNAVAGDE
jgi:U5 snRNP spliceosome subunit